MARRTNTGKESRLSVENLNQKCIQTLDKGVDTYKSITELQDLSVSVLGHKSGDLEMAIPEMEEVVVMLASEVSGGDIDKTKNELKRRGLDDIL